MDQHLEPEPAGQDTIEWRECSDTFVPPRRPLEDFLLKIEVRGETPELSPLIFIQDSAHEQMWADASRDLTREHGGIMMGEAFQDVSGRFYVIVREAVPALESNGSPTHLQFRAESWQPVWDTLQRNAGLRIVGWYHTHPRLGVFLSGTDLRTQRLYFSAPWQIAVVIDPVAHQIGYFFGMAGKKAQSIIRFSEKNPPLATATPR